MPCRLSSAPAAKPAGPPPATRTAVLADLVMGRMVYQARPGVHR
jgi:hypothetical protein